MINAYRYTIPQVVCNVHEGLARSVYPTWNSASDENNKNIIYLGLKILHWTESIIYHISRFESCIELNRKNLIYFLSKSVFSIVPMKWAMIWMSIHDHDNKMKSNTTNMYKNLKISITSWTHTIRLNIKSITQILYP